MADSRNLILAPRNLVDADQVVTTSASSNDIGTGMKTFVVATVGRLYKDAPVYVYKASDRTKWMRGTIFSLTLSGTIVVDVFATGGSGTGITDWSVELEMWTGGLWLADLPLANLATPELFTIARSTNALSTSTRGMVDFGQAVSIDLLSLLGGNPALTAQWRHRLLDIDPVSGAANIVYDSALLDLWPPDVEWGSLPWRRTPWSGRMPVPLAQRFPPHHFTREMIVLTSQSLNTIAGVEKTFVTDQATDDIQIGQQVSIAPTALQWNNLRAILGYVLDKLPNQLTVRVVHAENAVSAYEAWTIRALRQDAGTPGPRKSYDARFWRFDLLNPSQLDLGAAYAGPALQPSRNRANGMPVQIVDPSRVERSRGGQVYIDPRRPYRRFTLQIPYLQKDEAYLLFDDLRLLGRATPFLVFFDPGDVVNASRQTGYVVQAEQPVLRHQIGPWWSIDLTLEDYL